MLFRPALLGCLVGLSSLLAFAQDDTCPTPTADPEPIPAPAAAGGGTTPATTSTSTGGNKGIVSNSNKGQSDFITPSAKVKLEGKGVVRNLSVSNANNSTAAQPPRPPKRQGPPARRGGR